MRIPECCSVPRASSSKRASLPRYDLVDVAAIRRLYLPIVCIANGQETGPCRVVAYFAGISDQSHWLSIRPRKARWELAYLGPTGLGGQPTSLTWRYMSAKERGKEVVGNGQGRKGRRGRPCCFALDALHNEALSAPRARVEMCSTLRAPSDEPDHFDRPPPMSCPSCNALAPR